MAHWRDMLTPNEAAALAKYMRWYADTHTTPADGEPSLMIKMANLLDAEEAAKKLREYMTGKTPYLGKD